MLLSRLAASWLDRVCEDWPGPSSPSILPNRRQRVLVVRSLVAIPGSDDVRPMISSAKTQLLNRSSEAGRD
ncbi:hypothetical protein RRG08_048606 [Elysia crispata]|uniref:Uncharacterized protein n=1 Tax=Elysia crispata TaxID=231223 RepID=A0AAE1ADC8_9GAST|nr:hypothetical protein RRG08_048606 [Elysia crispata]